MSDAPGETPITVETIGNAIVARAKLKMVDDTALKTLMNLVDQASDANPAVTLVILDLSTVTIMPSMALGLLLQASTKCGSRRQRLKLAGLQPQLRRVFTITRLDRVFQYADSVEAAMA